ncbi:MAG: phage holin family protein [Verrucomicrobia bacterium]|nr:phage holin family protein [Verrucomicrobiota bacterium]
MNDPESPVSGLPGSMRSLARHALAAGENRLELLLVELQEERLRAFQGIGLSLAVAVLGLLAGISLTVAVVVVFWDHSRLWPILGLTVLYGGLALALARTLRRRLQTWQTLPETFNQIRRDLEAWTARLQ